MMNNPLLSAHVRSYIYKVALAVIPLLVIFGVIADEVSAHVLNLIAALLGLGSSATAVAYRPTKYETTADFDLVEPDYGE